MWARRSWLKPPVPIAFQAGPGLTLTAPPPVKVFPCISQTETPPVLMFCHRISERPSLLKSPVPTARQLGPGFGLTGPPPNRLFPVISQIEAWPLLVFRHRMSEEPPSALKSPVPTARQLGPGLELTAPPPTRLFPFVSQIEAWPLVFCHRISEWTSALFVARARNEGSAKPSKSSFVPAAVPSENQSASVSKRGLSAKNRRPH